MPESKTKQVRRMVPDRRGSSHASTRCALFSFFVILNVLLNSRDRQAGFCTPNKRFSMPRPRRRTLLQSSERRVIFWRSDPALRRRLISPLAQLSIGWRWRCLVGSFTERSMKATMGAALKAKHRRSPCRSIRSVGHGSDNSSAPPASGPSETRRSCRAPPARRASTAD